MNLLSSCCRKPLTWGIHQLTVGPVGKPIGYDALCTGCRKWVVSIPIEETTRLRLDTSAGPSTETQTRLPDGRWVTSDIWDYDRTLHFFSRTGKWRKDLSADELVPRAVADILRAHAATVARTSAAIGSPDVRFELRFPPH